MWRAAPVVALYCTIAVLAGCGSKHRSSTQPAPTQASAGRDSGTSENATGAVSTVPGLTDSGPHYASVEEWLSGRVAGLLRSSVRAPRAHTP